MENMMENENPLSKFYRVPGLHQTLPTNGIFFKEGDITLSINKELAVYPMTAADEIILKNPDALLNGHALEKLFQSCVPDIKSPREISIPDLDVILLAIKLASFGDKLEINVTCPSCGEEFTTTASIRTLLTDIKMIDIADTVVRINDEMVIYIKPYNFESKTKLDIATFEETKIYQSLLQDTIDDNERSKIFATSFEKIASLNLDLLSECIVKISIPNNEVTEQNFIKEFIKNCNKDIVDKIREKLAALGESGISKKLEVTCGNEKCGHHWETEMVFDPSHFFE